MSNATNKVSNLTIYSRLQNNRAFKQLKRKLKGSRVLECDGGDHYCKILDVLPYTGNYPQFFDCYLIIRDGRSKRQVSYHSEHGEIKRGGQGFISSVIYKLKKFIIGDQ